MIPNESLFYSYVHDTVYCYCACFVETGKELAFGHAPPFEVLMFSARSILFV